MSDGTSGLEALTLAPWEIVLRVFGADYHHHSSGVVAEASKAKAKAKT